MLTALLAWELGAGAGHCVNLQPIAAGLQERGWDVWLAARDLSAARNVLEQSCVKYLPAPVLIGPPPTPISPTLSFTHILHNTGWGDDRQLAVLAAAWRNLIELVRPDVLVCEHSPTALLASRRFDVRRVVVGTGFFSPPDVTPLPDVRFWVPATPEQHDRLKHDEAVIISRVNRLLQPEGAAPLDRISQLFAEVDANYLLTFAELDHYPQRTEATYWGMWPATLATKPVWPKGSGPRIFAYLKPLANPQSLTALLAALAERRSPCLVYMAGADLGRLRKHETPHLRFLQGPVAIGDVAQSCDLAVLNGNAGTATELLLAGVPQLHVPIYLEQAVFSKLVEGLGAGLTVYQDQAAQFTPRLAAALEDDQIRTAARKFASRYEDFDAAHSQRRIADEIAELC